MASVTLSGVNKWYAGVVHAVQDISFRIEDGEFFGLLGPSGSGKTSVLRMLAGLERPTSGTIAFDDVPVQARSPQERNVAMVFEQNALYPHMTARQNISYPLKIRGLSKGEIETKVADVANMLNIAHLIDRRASQMSGGQQQRVAIARALVFEPDLLLLDEPLAALDRKLREEMQLEFRRIQRELGVTTINVTHDQREALVVSDEIIVMDKGEIQQKAQPTETYRQPNNPFVANFIGVTNFLQGKALSSEAEGEVRFLHGDVVLRGRAGSAAASLGNGREVRGALRAEQIRIAGEEAALTGLDTVVSGEVEDAIFEGERVVYEISVPALDGAILRVFDHDVVGHTQFEAGRRVFLGWTVKDVLVFAG